MKGVIISLLFAAALFLGAEAASASYSADPSNYRLHIYVDYCNCDADCGDFSSCLTSDTEQFVLKMSNESYAHIKEAEEAGYKGVCSAITLNSDLLVYTMTKECPAEDTANRSQAAANASSPEIVKTSTSRIITINFDNEGAKTAPAKKTSSANTNTQKPSTGGYKMDVMSVSIIAGTVVLVGFFGLMAWIAYLLQKKSMDGKKEGH